MADKYGYLDFAEDVLKESTEPLLYQEIWALFRFQWKLA
jgi:hypothetical protein